MEVATVFVREKRIEFGAGGPFQLELHPFDVDTVAGHCRRPSSDIVQHMQHMECRAERSRQAASINSATAAASPKSVATRTFLSAIMCASSDHPGSGSEPGRFFRSRMCTTNPGQPAQPGRAGRRRFGRRRAIFSRQRGKARGVQ